MILKPCGKCSKHKPVSNFYKRSGGKQHLRRSWCKECEAIAAKRQIKEGDPVKRKAYKKKLYLHWNAQWETILLQHFSEKCADCQQAFPMWLFEYHHLVPLLDSRVRRIGNLRYNKPTDKRLKALLGVVQLCPNCHKIRHHDRERLSVNQTV